MNKKLSGIYKKILLIEDNPDHTFIINELLEESKEKFKLKNAETLEEGLKNILKDYPDIILLDLGLPDSIGYETFEKVYKNAKNIPIIVLTGLDDEELAIKSVGSGAQDYLLKKELDPKTISKAINYAIERKKLEREKESLMIEIKSEKDKLESLIDSIPDEVWFADMNKKFTLANPIALQGFEMDSAYKDVQEMAAELQVYNPDGSPRPVDEAPPLKALKGEIVKNQEEIVQIPATGKFRCRVVNAAPVRDLKDNIIGSISVVRDITERKKLEKELKESKERYEFILESANSGVFLLDPEHNIKYINEKMVEILGYTDQDMLNNNITLFLDVKEQKNIKKFMDDWRKGKKRINEYKFIRKDGSVFWALLAASPISDYKGKYMGVIGVIMDITARKSFENALLDRERVSKSILYDMMGMINKLMKEESKEEYSEKFDEKYDFT